MLYFRRFNKQFRAFQLDVALNSPVSVEILRPQYEFIVGMFARVNTWLGFVAIVVSNASFKISNSSSV